MPFVLTAVCISMLVLTVNLDLLSFSNLLIMLAQYSEGNFDAAHEVLTMLQETSPVRKHCQFRGSILREYGSRLKRSVHLPRFGS